MQVKQLNFVDGIAPTPFGPYLLGLNLDGPFFCFDGREREFKKGDVAEAQADFERRLRECFKENDDA